MRRIALLIASLALTGRPEGGACPLVSWNVDRYGYVLASVGEPMPPVAERRL